MLSSAFPDVSFFVEVAVSLTAALTVVFSIGILLLRARHREKKAARYEPKALILLLTFAMQSISSGAVFLIAAGERVALRPLLQQIRELYTSTVFSGIFVAVAIVLTLILVLTAFLTRERS